MGAREKEERKRERGTRETRKGEERERAKRR